MMDNVNVAYALCTTVEGERLIFAWENIPFACSVRNNHFKGDNWIVFRKRYGLRSGFSISEKTAGKFMKRGTHVIVINY